jgi:hypothetical protein
LGVTDGEFWEMIRRLSGSADPEAVEGLTAVLARIDATAITGFADRLAEALHALDRRSLAEQPFRDTEAPDGPVVSESADGFLYARCAVVAAGREMFERVLHDESAFARPWDLGAEGLLEVAPEAYERATGREWDHVEPVSYESAANDAGWA